MRLISFAKGKKEEEADETGRRAVGRHGRGDDEEIVEEERQEEIGKVLEEMEKPVEEAEEQSEGEGSKKKSNFPDQRSEI